VSVLRSSANQSQLRISKDLGTAARWGRYPAHDPEGFLQSRSSPSTPSARDEALVAQAAEGDRGAFTALVERYGVRVLAVIEKQIADHHGAHDLAQEVWLRVFGALRNFRTDASFRPWLFAIVFNCVRDEHHSRARRKSHVQDLQPAHIAGAAAPGRYDPSGRIEEFDTIDRALALVPEPFRAALQLVDALGFSYEEAARSLDCSAGTVKSRVHRGRLAFRDVYERCSGKSARPGSAIPDNVSPRSGAVRASVDSKEGLK
jgi:RNA polymerase sigma-70 factor (ECF subfamily)